MDSKGLRIGIIGGLISSVTVLIFIQPILSLLWRLILTVGGSIHEGYVDRIYRSAALVDFNLSGQLTIIVLIFIISFAGLFWFLDDMGKSIDSRNEYHVVPTYLSRLVKAFRVFAWTTLLMSILAVLMACAILKGTSVITASFTQRLTVLAPAINDIEYKTLRARWAGMQGKADYDALVSDIDRRATELGVKLPPVRKP